MTVTAKAIRSAAASVRGARGAGISTSASEAAPALLTQAEALLARLDGECGMHSSPAELKRVDALESAVAELRDALGISAHAPAAEKAATPHTPAPVAATPSPAALPAGKPDIAPVGDNGKFVPVLHLRVAIKTNRQPQGGWDGNGNYEILDDGSAYVGRIVSMDATDPRYAALAEEAAAANAQAAADRAAAEAAHPAKLAAACEKAAQKCPALAGALNAACYRADDLAEWMPAKAVAETIDTYATGFDFVMNRGKVARNPFSAANRQIRARLVNKLTGWALETQLPAILGGDVL